MLSTSGCAWMRLGISNGWQLMRQFIGDWFWLLIFFALVAGFGFGGWSSSGETKHWLDSFFELKLTDLVIAIFTVVLAIKTSGLFVETAGLRAAAEKQSQDMERSIRAATDAVGTAIAANQIATTTSQQQLRAYLTAKEINLNVIRGPSMMGAYGPIAGAIHTFAIAPVVFNGGQTPATNAVVNSSTRHFPGPMQDDFDFPDSEHYGYGVIGPQSEFHGPEANIPIADVDPALGGIWYLWGWVEYDDIFTADTRHRTEFCFEIMRSRRPDGTIWLGFRPTPRFNAVDGGCLRPIDPATGRSGQ
ncbi:MAG: hypothetical protein WBF59_23445 [Bradyrhizobium sp.]|uniref:hypothetical protein n=1 Tax=Bradyrhizobium sp. TaxID=376 RepID=UPI003C729715